MIDEPEWNGAQTLWQCFWFGREGSWFYGRHERNEYLEEYVSSFHCDKDWAWSLLHLFWRIEDFFCHIQSIRRGKPLYKGDWEETWTVREYVYVVLIRNPLNDLLDFVKYRVIRMTYHDSHIVCYSYPNCDEAPSGCVVENGDNAEPYGHRD